MFCISFLTMSAQKVELSGTVRSQKTKEKLPFVAVTIFNAETNKLIEYTTSNDDGKYSILIEEGISVYMKAEILGYQDYTSLIFVLSKNLNKDIFLDEKAEELEEVLILSKKKLITFKGDKLVYDIANSGLGDGNDGIETISKLPGMRLDKDENIVFRGSGNLQVLINGKRSLLKGDALTQYLKTIGGENIEKIEVITNPSARYDAEGTAGIINIQLKKGKLDGFTGSLNTSIGGEYLRNNNAGTVFYQSGKWNLNATGRYYKYNSVNNREIVRTVATSTGTNAIEQLNDWLPKSNYSSLKLGAEYSINKNNTLGTSWNYNVDKTDETTIGRTNEFINQQQNKYTLLNEKGNNKDKTLTGNVYYTFQTDSLDTKITTQFNYASYKNSKFQTTKNEYFLIDNTKYQNDFTIQLNNPTSYKIANVKVDVEQKINKKMTLEGGLKYSKVKNDYNNEYAVENASGVFVDDSQISNHLLYDESIFSGYVQWMYATEKWNFQAGVRSENIKYTSNSLTINQINSNHYTSWFPSFSINRILENNKFQFSYSRRIQRPQYLDLNPFYKYLDTYNIDVGNPNLKPQFADAFNLAWIYKNKTSFSLYASKATDVIYDKVAYNPTTGITVNSKDNIANSTNVGVSFSTSIAVKKWWDISLNADASYNRMKSNIINYTFDEKGTNWYVTLENEFSLPKKWKLFASGYYDNGGVSGNWNNKPSYDVSFRMRKTFLDNKWKVQLKGDNLLKKSLFSSVITQGNVTTDWTNKWETRRIMFSVTYNFGSGKKKRIKNTDLRDEQNRL